MIYRPISQRSPRSADLEAWRRKCRDVVIDRSKYRCEVCRRKGTDWMHLWGRGNSVLGEPLASSPEATAMGCRDCHDRVDGRVRDILGFRDRLREVSVQRMLDRWAGELDLGVTPGMDTVGCARQIEAALRRTEWWQCPTV